MSIKGINKIYNNIEQLNAEVIKKHIENGVVFTSLHGVYIDENVLIGEGTIIDSDNHISGNSIIGKNVLIGSGNIIKNAKIGNGVDILKSVVKDCSIGSGTTVGPFAHVHTRADIARDCRIGNYVEIKNSKLGINTKVAHLAYVGDADVGDKCNIGCGSIFVNYDGKNKHRSIVGDRVFIGSNSNIVAPVTIEDGAFIAAGTTVTLDLPMNCMCIGRNRETIKEDRSNYRMIDYDKKYFGTDGIRGLFGSIINCDLAYLVGNYLGYSANGGKVVIGRDTRVSGAELSAAICKGVIDAGSDVVNIDITSTPCVAYVTQSIDANYGVMLTASHNPPEYNGIKVFNCKGSKLTNIEEIEIERHIELNRPIINDVTGSISTGESFTDDYITFVKSILPNIKGMKVVIDCANGGAYALAKKVFDDCGCECIIEHTESDGVNINNGCGAMCTDECSRLVLEHKADIGFSFDGDADRIMVIDKNGKLVDGDDILYVIAKNLQKADKLFGNTVVGTIMTNAGVERSLNDNGIKLIRTNVGDHYIADVMSKERYVIGGEASGHIILGELVNTGDGLLVACYLCNILKQSKTDIDKLVDCYKYPQISVGIISELKSEIAADPKVIAYTESLKSGLGVGGRVIVRASGTEPKLRITVECESELVAVQNVEKIKLFIEKLYNIK